MSQKQILFAFLIPILSLFTACEQSTQKEPKVESQQDSTQIEENKKEIQKRVGTYVDAINKKDKDALVEFWSEEAVFRNPVTGDLVQGKEGIKKEYNRIFDKMQHAEVEIKAKTIEFPFDDKAVVNGTVVLIEPEQSPIESPYKMIFVNRGGQWMILNVSTLDFSVLNESD